MAVEFVLGRVLAHRFHFPVLGHRIAGQFDWKDCSKDSGIENRINLLRSYCHSKVAEEFEHKADCKVEQMAGKLKDSASWSLSKD